jgi:hypothetical protein
MKPFRIAQSVAATIVLLLVLVPLYAQWAGSRSRSPLAAAC